jgi:hypothetical protein
MKLKLLHQRFGQSIILLALFFLSEGHCDDALSRARDEANAYIFECDELLDSYLMLCKLKVDSSPDAPILLSSTGSMAKLLTPTTALEEVRWKPIVYDDARKGKAAKAAFVFSDFASCVYLTREDRKFVMIGEKLRLKTEKPLLPYDAAKCVDLFDWPLMDFSIFVDDQTKVSRTSRVFSKADRCFHASTTPNGALISYWAQSDIPHAYTKCVFVDGLLVRSELCYVGPDFKPKDDAPNPAKARLLSVVETRWKRFGSGSVPENVVAVMERGSLHETATYNVVVEIQVFGDETKEFKEQEKKMNELVLKIPSN